VSHDAQLDVLREFHRDKLTLRERHVSVAKVVDNYAFNNTYQNVISRDDVHLSWLEAAIADLGGTPDTVDAPVLPARGKRDSFLPLVEEDARNADAFVTSWRPRLDEVVNARHRRMLGVVLGETLEQRRFFLQITAGREDLLGRRSNGPGKVGTGDGVLPARWIE
jgi:hypothetical protein